MRGTPRFYSFPTGSDPLAILADAVRQGFPVGTDAPPLHHWTVFLPTRRAVRLLGRLFHKLSGGKSLLLPQVRPIDDIDEDIVQLNSADDLLPAISQQAQVFLLTKLVKDWASAEPQLSIACDVLSSDVRAFGLAQSLAELIDQMETEDLPLEKLGQAYDFGELAEHRDAILGLLAIVKDIYPAKLAERGLMGRAARRNEVIRLQARHIANGRIKGPVVAAGSTGSNPATAELLRAIALHPQGAVVLPGLDKLLSDVDWLALEPTHPQYGLNRLLDKLGVARSEVEELGSSAAARAWLAHEIMRPTTSTEKWKDSVATGAAQIRDALKGITIVEAENRHLEARTIALRLREVLEHKSQTAALITPDRDLALRVKAELQRWDVVIDDTAGEPLTRFGLANLLQTLQESVAEGFTAASLLQVLHHPLLHLGQAARHLELVAFRQQGFEGGIDNVLHALTRAEIERSHDPHLHPAVKRLSELDWKRLRTTAEQFCRTLRPLESKEPVTLSQCLDVVSGVLKSIAPTANPDSEENQQLSALFEAIREASGHGGTFSLHDALTMIIMLTRKEQLRVRQEAHPRLAIMGLAEARMMRPEVVVLGGLNEGKWPRQIDPGPWLNRTMRDNIGLARPERAIGLTAHDFTEAFAQGEVMLTWSKRDQQQPLVPSRWVLRLRMLMEGTKLNFGELKRPDITRQSRLIDQPKAPPEPRSKPKPMPPAAARPKSFSVTDIVKLNRDPYHLYARKVLRLEPIEKLGAEADARLRGTLFHEAFGKWNAAQPLVMAQEPLRLLLEQGEAVLKPLKSDVGLHLFWSTRFERIALWLAEIEPALRRNAVAVHAEKRGKLFFDVAGERYELRGIADRIDVLRSGARIIDYKTSSSAVPSSSTVVAGWDPQLTLEAAMLMEGCFDGIAPVSVTELSYIAATGSTSSMRVTEIEPSKEPVFALAQRHLEGLKRKLSIMAQVDTAYLPRVHMQKVDDTSDYDHLSRFREWRMAKNMT